MTSEAAASYDDDPTPIRPVKRSKRWQSSTDPQPDDGVPVRLPRHLRDEVVKQRDRLDPATDGLGRRRKQQTTSDFVERLVRKGLQWAKTLPDWQDPLAVDE